MHSMYICRYKYKSQAWLCLQCLLVINNGEVRCAVGGGKREDISFLAWCFEMVTSLAVHFNFSPWRRSEFAVASYLCCLCWFLVMVTSGAFKMEPAIRKPRFPSIQYSGLKNKKMFEILCDKDLPPPMVSLVFEPHPGSCLRWRRFVSEMERGIWEGWLLICLSAHVGQVLWRTWEQLPAKWMCLGGCSFVAEAEGVT